MLTEMQTRWLVAHEAGTTRLAALVSLAALADPGLVRAARIALELPVGAELDLRCSPIVASGSHAGLVLAEEALPVLRARLDRPLLDLAWQLTSARHEALSPALVLEETLTWESLAESLAGALADAPEPEAVSPSAETRLNRALVAIVRGKQTQLAGWAARALPRLPAKMRELPSAKLLASAAQANGYRIGPALGVDGPPPAWMLPQPPGSVQVQGSVALFGTTLEISCPPRSGEQTLPLPENRRIWISWWQAQRRVWTERTVARNRTLVLEVEGAQIVIEAPGFGRVVIEDQAAPWAEIATFGSVDLSGLQLQQALRDRLGANGVRVLVSQDTVASRANSPNYLLVVTGPAQAGNLLGALQSSSQQDWVSQSLAQCRPVLVLEAPGAPPLPSLLADEGLDTFDCRDRSQSDQRIDEAVKRVLAGPPVLTEVTGAPPLPAAFVRRQALYAEMKAALLRATRSDPVVNVWGPAGSGRTMAAADLVRDCAIRRRFQNGIFWTRRDEWQSGNRVSWDPVSPAGVPHATPNVTPSWWHEELRPPYLIVLEDVSPSTEELDVGRLAGQLTQVDGRCLLLTLERVVNVPAAVNVPAINGAVWQSEEMLALFRKSVSAQENESEIESAFDLVPQAAHELKGTYYIHRIMPARNVANLGRLAGMTVRSGEKPESAFDLFANKQLLESLFELNMVEPFAACPPGWKFAEPGDPIWLRYFAPAYQPRIGEAHLLVTQAFADSEGLEIAPWASRALVELALPTHGRIVESYRQECGGDWAICADDGYYLKFFAWHLLHLDHITELTENIDWLMRAGREAPGWHKVLPSSVGLGYLDSADQALTLEYFAHSWPPGAFFGQTSKVGISGSRRMAEARLALRDGATVRWILVVGSRNDSLDPMLSTLSECVGRELARWGYGLLTDRAPGVVAITEQAYSAQLRTNDFPPGTGVQDAVEFANYTEEPPRQGSVQPDENAWNEALAERADAVVVIADPEDTGEVLQMVQMNLRLVAAGRMVPVIPMIPNAGAGDPKMTSQPNPDAWAAINKKPESRADCYAMAKALITLLPENPSQDERGVLL